MYSIYPLFITLIKQFFCNNSSKYFISLGKSALIISYPCAPEGLVCFFYSQTKCISSDSFLTDWIIVKYSKLHSCRIRQSLTLVIGISPAYDVCIEIVISNWNSTCSHYVQNCIRSYILQLPKCAEYKFDRLINIFHFVQFLICLNRFWVVHKHVNESHECKRMLKIHWFVHGKIHTCRENVTIYIKAFAHFTNSDRCLSPRKKKLRQTKEWTSKRGRTDRRYVVVEI